MSSTVPSPRDLMGLARDRAMAEAAEWRAMLEFRDAEVARIEGMDVSVMRRQVERSAIAVEVGLSLGLSAGQVVQKLATAERLRDLAPLTWWAFGRGRIDAARAREISLTLERLERAESHHRLDGVVVAYASSHTVVELRAWLRRFVSRVEADLAIERANEEREKRHVEVVQVEDSMAWLNAYLPAHQAAAIQTRLKRTAKALGADDDRSKAQREADLLVDALLNNPVSDDGRPSGMKIDIGVLVEAKTLTCLTDGHAESTDGSWQVPSEWIIDSALAGDAFWHRLLVDPITGDTLAHDYPGYQPPDVSDLCHLPAMGRAKPACRAVTSASESRGEREERARPGTTRSRVTASSRRSSPATTTPAPPTRPRWSVACPATRPASTTTSSPDGSPATNPTTSSSTTSTTKQPDPA